MKYYCKCAKNAASEGKVFKKKKKTESQTSKKCLSEGDVFKREVDRWTCPRPKTDDTLEMADLFIIKRHF